MPPRSLHATAAALLGAAFLAASPAQAAEPLPALDPPYPGLTERQMVGEVQSWWVPAFGHIHVTAVLPRFGEDVSGVISVPTRWILHDNPALAFRVELVARDGRDNEARVLAGANLDQTCKYNGEDEATCAFSAVFKVDTRRLRNGLKQFNFVLQARTPDGKEYRTSSRFPVRFQNDGRGNNGDALDKRGIERSVGCEENSIFGRGWYDEPIDEYASVHLLCLPTRPVRGSYDFMFAGGPRRDLDQTVGYLSRTHAIPAVNEWPAQSARDGRLLFEKANAERPFRRTVDADDLAPGWHTVSIRGRHPRRAPSECDWCGDVRNRLHGAAVFWFRVVT